MSAIHKDQHPLAGKTVRLSVKPNKVAALDGREYRIEDWWDRVGEQSWMDCNGNMACMLYGMRSAVVQLPVDDEVVYGKAGAFGHLIHVSELGEEVKS